mgnify:CR=1 FL=1|jgi:excisionase family DNA binding protein
MSALEFHITCVCKSLLVFQSDFRDFRTIDKQIVCPNCHVVAKIYITNYKTSERVLTPKEVATYLNVSERTVYKWLRAGKIRSTKIGRLWHIRQSALLALEQTERDTEEVKTWKQFIGGSQIEVKE